MKYSVIKIMGGVAILLTAISCMTVPVSHRAGSDLTPVTDALTPMKFQGFSVFPPSGDDWLIVNQNTYKVSFIKQLGDGTSQPSGRVYGPEAQVRTYFVGPQLTSHEKILDDIAEGKRKRVNAGERFLEFNSSKDSSFGADCLQYGWTLEDRGVPVMGRAAGEIVIREEHGRACLHQDYPQYVIELSYRQEYLKGKQPSFPVAELDHFLNSLKFNHLEKPMLTAVIKVGPRPQGMIFSHGTVWVAMMDNQKVARIDPRTNTITATIPLGTTTVGMAADENAVWVTNQREADVSRIDPVTNAVIVTIPVGKEPLLVAVGGGSAWVTNSMDNTVSRIDPMTNKVVATIKVGKYPCGVAYGEGSVWIVNRHENTVSRVDPGTNTVMATIPTGKSPERLIVDNGMVWVSNGDDGTVSVIDPKTNTAVDEIVVGGQPGALTAFAGAIWIADFKNNAIVRIDPRTTRVVGQPVPVGSRPLMLANDGKALWVSNLSDGTVMRIEP